MIAETDGKLLFFATITYLFREMLYPLLCIFSMFFILVIIFLLFINLQVLKKIQQLTYSLSEEMKYSVLYSDLSDHFPILHYSVIKVNRVKLSKEIRQNNSFLLIN